MSEYYYIGELELTPENTALFKFVGESAIGPHNAYNHVFFAKEDEEGEVEFYAYLFSDNDEYDELVKHIQKNNYPQHLNMPEVSEVDQIAFDATHYNEEMTFPEDWCEEK